MENQRKKQQLDGRGYIVLFLIPRFKIIYC